MKIIFKLVCSLLLFFPAKGIGHGHGHHHHDHDDEFTWTEEKSAFADIKVDVAGSGKLKFFTQTSGKILTHPDHIAYVFPQIQGTVYSINKNVGDPVKKGETLAVIESKEIAEVKSSYLRALNRYGLQEEKLKQENALRGISPKQDFLDAKLAYDEAAIDYECAQQHLFTLGFTKMEIEQIGQESPSKRRFYELKSPLSGKVLSRNLTLGELTDDSLQAFTVGNFDKVWVEMHVNQEDVRHLKEKLPVIVMAAGGKKEKVRICQLNPMICEETRMATAVAVLENSAQKWTPGQYVNALITTKTIEAPVVISKEAIQKMKGENYVFVKCKENFEPVKVKLGKMDEKNVEILSGLKEGDYYVSRNAFCLKADYEKEEVEHSH